MQKHIHPIQERNPLHTHATTYLDTMSRSLHHSHQTSCQKHIETFEIYHNALQRYWKTSLIVHNCVIWCLQKCAHLDTIYVAVLSLHMRNIPRHFHRFLPSNNRPSYPTIPVFCSTHLYIYWHKIPLKYKCMKSKRSPCALTNPFLGRMEAKRVVSKMNMLKPLDGSPLSPTSKFVY